MHLINFNFRIVNFIMNSYYFIQSFITSHLTYFKIFLILIQISINQFVLIKQYSSIIFISPDFFQNQFNLYKSFAYEIFNSWFLLITSLNLV